MQKITTIHRLEASALPPGLAPVALEVAKLFGVPAGTCALLMASLLGGVMSGGVRLRFQFDTQPLGLHLALIEAAIHESRKLLERLMVPLADEVERLKELAKKTPDLQALHDSTANRLKAGVFSGAEAEDQKKILRELRIRLHPHLAVARFPTKDTLDGLGAPVVLADIETYLKRGKHEVLAAFAESYDAPEGMSMTVVSRVSLPTARALQEWGEIHAGVGWPMLGAPLYGEDFVPVDASAAEAAMTAWSDLVRKALVHRYRKPRTLELDPACYPVIQETKKEAETLAHQDPALPTNWMVSTLLRIGAVEQLLKDAQSTGVNVEALRAAQPLVSWASRCQPASLPSRPKSTVAYQAALPAKKDVAKALNLRARYPETSVRELRRKLPTRPPGYWTAVFNRVSAMIAAKPAAATANAAAANAEH